MNIVSILEQEWEKCYQELAGCEFLRALAERRIHPEAYKGLMRETYFNSYENPRIMALFQAHLKTEKSELVAKFLKHTAMEVGHHEMALDDLRTLGEDTEGIRRGRPLPTTEAFAAFIVYQIQHRNPVAYLGYCYHLEALPLRVGADAMAAFAHAGIPAEAQTFLKEHSEADIVHMKWNREYLEGFIKDEADLEAVLYAMRGTSRLYGILLQGILDERRGLMGKPFAQASAGNRAAA